MVESRLFSKALHITIVILLYGIDNSKELDVHEGGHNENRDFCYPNTECWDQSGKDERYWPGACKSGSLQSPIDLPAHPAAPRTFSLTFSKAAYQGTTFYITNNGHTVVGKLERKTNRKTALSHADITSSKDGYLFHRFHFHWGENDNVGSEHSIGGKTYALEMHMVHFRNKYASLEDAAASKGDPAALMVVAILFEASHENPNYAPLQNVFNKLPKKQSADLIEIPVALDLNPLMPKSGAEYYKFKGSLTTPPCSEIVQWVVFRKPIKISSDDVNSFRGLTDYNGFHLSRNFRNVQLGNSRSIQYFRLP